jgi:hypothetical protein
MPKKQAKLISNDVHILREGDGDLVVEFTAGDRVMTDFNSFSNVLGPLGYHYDGQQFTDFTGLTQYSFTAGDFNGDGRIDTRIDVNDDSITLLGVAPDQLTSATIFGG